MIRCVLTLLLALLAIPIAGGVHAEGWPSKPVRLIVPYAPGGPVDMVARLLAASISPKIGQPVLVENRPGGNALIGMREVSVAEADGHTFGVVLDAIAAAPTVSPEAGFDLEKDFTPVSMAVRAPTVYVVNPSRPWKSFGDLVADAKARPGQISFANSATSAVNLSVRKLQKDFGFSLLSVTINSAAPAVQAVLGGHVDLYGVMPAAVLANIRANGLRAIGVSSSERWPALPDVPTLAETAFPGFSQYNWVGVIAPPKLPAEILTTFNALVGGALRDPAVHGPLREQGFEVSYDRPEEFRNLVLNDAETMRRLFDEVGVR